MKREEMIQSTKRVSLGISQDFDLIECPFCNRGFLMFAVWEAEDEYYGEKYFKILPHGRCDYCPYCGKEQKISVNND